jgi:hypothetical protein
VCTAQEEHGGDKHLIRVRYRMRPSGSTKALVAVAGLGAASAAALLACGYIAGPSVLLVLCVGLAAFCLAAWVRGTYRARQALAVFDAMAAKLRLLPCEETDAPASRGR